MPLSTLACFSLRTTLALQHDAKTTAVAALYLAFKFLKMQAPEGQAWWLTLHSTAKQDTLEGIPTQSSVFLALALAPRWPGLNRHQQLYPRPLRWRRD